MRARQGSGLGREEDDGAKERGDHLLASSPSSWPSVLVLVLVVESSDPGVVTSCSWATHEQEERPQARAGVGEEHGGRARPRTVRSERASSPARARECPTWPAPPLPSARARACPLVADAAGVEARTASSAPPVAARGRRRPRPCLARPAPATARACPPRASRGRLRHGRACPPVADAAGVAARTAGCGPANGRLRLAGCPPRPCPCVPAVADAAGVEARGRLRPRPCRAPPRPAQPRRCLARPARGGERGAAGVVDGDARAAGVVPSAPRRSPPAGAARSPPRPVPSPRSATRRRPLPDLREHGLVRRRGARVRGVRGERRAAVLGFGRGERAAARGSTARRRPFTHPWPSLCASPSTSFVAGAHFGSGNFR
nr:uncharacterized protein LOC127331071 [Lolium perenne]